jgi:hypothetical protein
MTLPNISPEDLTDINAFNQAGLSITTSSNLHMAVHNIAKLVETWSMVRNLAMGRLL